MKIDFEELYKPYSGKISLEETLTWLFKTATQAGISKDLIDKAVSETFIEMATGKTFPTDGGDTGFDGFPHAVLNHYMLKKAIKLNSISRIAYAKAVENRIQTRLDILVNKRWDKSWRNWNKSQVIQAFNWVKSKVK